MTYNSTYSNLPNKSLNTIDSGLDLIPVKSTIGTTLCLVVALTLSPPFDDLHSSKYKLISPKLEGQNIYSSSRQDLKLVAEVRNKKHYKNNWDGNGAIAPTKQAITEAGNFIRELTSTKKIQSPIISLATDGEVNFLWKLNKFELDLGFYGDNTYSYYGITKEGIEFMSDVTNCEEKLPDEIIKLMLSSNQA